MSMSVNIKKFEVLNPVPSNVEWDGTKYVPTMTGPVLWNKAERYNKKWLRWKKEYSK